MQPGKYRLTRGESGGRTTSDCESATDRWRATCALALGKPSIFSHRFETVRGGTDRPSMRFRFWAYRGANCPTPGYADLLGTGGKEWSARAGAEAPGRTSQWLSARSRSDRENGLARSA